MSPRPAPHRNTLASALYGLLDPIPFGCFVAGLIFDILYANTATILWTHAASWVILFGLLFAIVPRLIQLVHVWFTGRHEVTTTDRLDFWLQLLAIVAAIFNAFVHSADAYAVVPQATWLSIITVLLLAIARVLEAVRRPVAGGYVHG